MAEKHTCCAEVLRGTEWRPRKEACGCKASVERDGKWYCKRHDPVAKAEKQDAQLKAWRLELAAKEKKNRLEQAAPDLLAALKQSIGPLELYHAYGWPDRDGVINKVKSAISKAEGES